MAMVWFLVLVVLLFPTVLRPIGTWFDYKTQRWEIEGKAEQEAWDKAHGIVRGTGK